MIGYLSGRVLDVSENRLLLGIGGESGVVGYSVGVPGQVQYSEILKGQKLELFIYTHVREDVLDLYGFLTSVEKDLFLTLLTVSGIGPKGAMGVLSSAPPEQIVQAVMDKDKDALIAMPGIGKKTAERIVVELADSLHKKSGIAGTWVLQLMKSQRSATAGSEGRTIRDAREALVGLGYPDQRVGQVLKQLQGAGPVAESVEVLIRSALKELRGLG